MSLSEVFLVLAVAIVVLGPKQWPVIIDMLGKGFAFYHQGREKIKGLMREVMHTQQLNENVKKAQEVDELYQDKNK